MRPERKIYERLYRAAARAAGKLRDYERAYNRRPEVVLKNRLRMREPHFGMVVPSPYTGQRWLEMAREAVGAPDPEAPWADDRYDEMGEAVLALLEGRDMKEAVSAYRKSEYVPRHLTIHMGDWGDDEDQQNRWFESVMPTAPSAEDVAIARLEPQPLRHWGDNPRRFNKNKGQSTPSNRRSNRR
jgi:hypothetical protein